MKKIFVPLLIVLVMLVSGCHRMVPEEDQALTLYASFYPVYVLALNVVQDVPGVTLKCLTQPQDGCLRRYELSEWDLARLTTADALVIGGRGLESFEALVGNGALPVVKAMDALALAGEENAKAQGDDEQSHFTGFNPWLWLSPDGALQMAEAIAGAMGALDPRYQDVYMKNLAAFEKKIAALKKDMRAQGRVALAHEGLSYFANACGLTAVAMIEREPGTDIDETRMISEIENLKASGAKVVLIEEQAPGRLARELEREGFSVVKIDTLSSRFLADPDTYAVQMKENAERVRAAFQPNSNP